jgi:hypothetical protein
MNSVVIICSVFINPALQRGAFWSLDIFREVQRQDAAASSRSPVQGDTIVAQGQQGAGAPSAALGQGFNPFHLLSPRSAALAAIRGERLGEGGIPGPITNQAFRRSIHVDWHEASVS